MIAVGLLSVQIGGRGIWTVPLAFVLFLGVGGALGLFGIPLPEVEGAISISVLALGLAIAFQTRLPIWLAMAFVGFFAIFHGHAHGEEIPTLADPWTYVAGFMLASALLHLIGVGLGLLGNRPQLRAHLGSACAGIGAHLLLLTYGIV
jgi:urease accessory protein